jgi:hypothetical protein
MAKRWVHQYQNDVLDSKIIEGETPSGWFDLIREAQLAARSDTKVADLKSPVADKNVADAKAEIDGIEDAETLHAIIDLDTRKGVTEAAKARLTKLIGE